MIPLPQHEKMEALLRPRRATEDGFFAHYDPYVVICFSAEWCGPCKKLDKQTIVDMTPSITWYAVDVDVNETSLGYCGCQKIPSFVIIKDGIFNGKLEGPRDANHVLEWLKINNFPVTTH